MIEDDDDVIDVIDSLYDERSDPDTRLVLEDWERTVYETSSVARLGYALLFGGVAAADSEDGDVATTDFGATADIAESDIDDHTTAADAVAADVDAVGEVGYIEVGVADVSDEVDVDADLALVRAAQRPLYGL